MKYIENFKRIIDKYADTITVTRKGLTSTDQNTGNTVKQPDQTFNIKAHCQPLTSTIVTKGNITLNLTPETMKVQGAQWIFSYDELKINDEVTIDGIIYLIKKVDPWHGHWESAGLRKEYQNA